MPAVHFSHLSWVKKRLKPKRFRHLHMKYVTHPIQHLILVSMHNGEWLALLTCHRLSKLLSIHFLPSQYEKTKPSGILKVMDSGLPTK